MQYDHYNVKIDAFEGPLDLLLHLINRLEIDIYDIPVSEITEQYLLYIHTMKELQLDVASEYLVMAATLLAIKSKMLLPKHEEEELEDEFGMDMEEDPRDELVERLIEYRKFKEAADELKEREQERSLMFTKPPADLSDFIKDAQPERAELNVSLYDMLGALQKLLRRKKLQRPLSTKIARQEIPIEKRMSEIVEQLKKFKGRKSFNELFPVPDREHIVVTFLAVLELIKRREILVEQDQNFSEIVVASMEGGEKLGDY
ncbi:segregation/condensation protein A [Aeromicrobium ponti]|uniref:Segregation and condensation protein A n=1 Tax=Cytobacillus oceanisediminis TaxID=665099 RepID=A0A562K106_9BACI|nr:segregation/condensation protein A [Cytobacillus oceanisediminis]TWH89056.1 condensin subunit ScpA [Cytobacillus oceanisediminis]